MTLWTTSQLRRLTENQDRHMCQTYPGYRHSQAGQAQIGNPSQNRQASRCTLIKAFTLVHRRN